MPKSLDPSARLKRLEALADLWGKVALFHPAIVTSDIDWNQALVRTIPRVEAAETPEDLAAAINEELLQPLDDLLTFACVQATSPKPQGTSRDLEARRLTGSIGYVRIPPAASRGPEFLTDFQAGVEALGKVEKIVVDLRWPVALGYRVIDPVLQFFVRTRLSMSPVMKRVHVGWNEDNSQSPYQQKWEVSAGAALQPIQEAEWFVTALCPGTDFTQLKTIALPTVLLVNRPFATRYCRALDALQSQPGVAVVFEPSGPPVAEQPFRLEYPEGLVVQLNTERLVGHAGNGGFRPDLVADGAIGSDQLTEVAEKARLAAASRKPQATSSEAANLVDLTLPALLSGTGENLTREERLLGLFKAWSVIRYLDPHVELCDMDWSSCLSDWIPKVEAADSLLAYARALRMLTAHLHDNNVFYFFPNLPEPQSLPVFFGCVEGKIVVTDVMGAESGGSATDLQVCDELVEFDGKTVPELVTDYRLQVSYSTEGAFCQRMCDMLAFGTAGSEVKMVVRRGEQLVPLALKRAVTRQARIAHSARRRSSGGYRLLDQDIGYIDLARLASLGEFERSFEALRQARGLIVDIRGYPGFTVQLALCARLIDRPIKSAIYEVPIVSGYDREEHVWSIGQYEVKPDPKVHYGGPVVVLVNEKTFGGAEDVCIYLRNAERVTFVGGTTAGCNGNRAWLSLPGGGRLWFTGMRVKFGDGRPFQNIGVVPEVPAAPTVEGVRAGRDELLEKGLEVLRQLVRCPSSSAPEQARNEGRDDKGRQG
ncbi:hypothetical protein JXD38_11150 [candidate division WOR-3 bacterium]|nr:hypothetical protein [candidate division WOR-3 bacterium]